MGEGTWPDDWDERMAGRDCPLCDALGPQDNDFLVGVHHGRWADVFLERRSRLPGYCVVVWDGAHVAEPSDLAPEDAAGYGAEVVDVGRALRDLLDPAKINYLTLGNGVPHLHTHVVARPRAGDPVPGGPLPWDAMVGPHPRPEAELRAQATDIRRRLDGGRRPGRPVG